MSFLNELYVIDERPSINKRYSIFDNNIPGGIRHCEWIWVDESYALSIQASEFHHCIPRGLVPLKDYTHFEMALIYEGSLTSNTSIIKDFNRYDELMECFDDCIFNEVPKDLIEDLYRYLKKEF